jgi:pimeloyl-ACP methyl ester carboxylesterase
MGQVVEHVAFPVPDPARSAGTLQSRQDLLWLTTATEEEDVIPAVHIRRNMGADRTILYSHGNAEDLGLILALLERIAEACVADIFAYEYPGYGISDGSPSEDGCYAAVEAAYDHLTRNCRVDPSRIIAMGRSIGSGPTVELVSQHREIRGMVLMSPIASGIGIFGQTTAKYAYNIDIFRNYEKCDEIVCPVLVMHGVQDAVVPFENGETLHRACRNAVEPLWIPHAGHNNMPEQECTARLREFLDNMDGLGFAYGIFRQKVASHMTVAL